MKKRKYVKTDSQIQYYPVRWPTYFNSINFNMKNEILEYYNSNINKIESIELKTQIQNFIDYVAHVDMAQDWETIENEGGVDAGAIEAFNDVINFGNKFNKMELPKNLTHLKNIINKLG
jgi:hypothetical protein